MITLGGTKGPVTSQALFPAAAHAEQKRDRYGDVKALPRSHGSEASLYVSTSVAYPGTSDALPNHPDLIKSRLQSVRFGESAISRKADTRTGGFVSPEMTDTVDKVLFGGCDVTLIRKDDSDRDDDSL